MKDDVINRQDAIDVLTLGEEILSRVLDDMDVVGTLKRKYLWGLELIESCIEDIEELPPAHADLEEMTVICDNCGHSIHVKKMERKKK